MVHVWVSLSMVGDEMVRGKRKSNSEMCMLRILVVQN